MKGDEEMAEIRYTRCGEYLVPDRTLDICEQMLLGRYGRMRKKYLQEHRPILWNALILNGTLDAHLWETDVAAKGQIERVMMEMMKTASVNEQLKADDPMRWVQTMNALKAQAEEAVLQEIVFR